MAEDAFTPPLIEPWIEVSNQIWPQLQAAILGEKTPQEALDKAADAAREVMEDAGYIPGESASYSSCKIFGIVSTLYKNEYWEHSPRNHIHEK